MIVSDYNKRLDVITSSQITIQCGICLISRAIDPCINLLSRAFKRQFVLPEFHHFCKEIENIYEHCKSNTDGTVSYSSKI